MGGVCVARSLDRTSSHQPHPKKDYFKKNGLGGGEEACGPQEMNRKFLPNFLDRRSSLRRLAAISQGCKPHHGRGDRRQERSFRGLSPTWISEIKARNHLIVARVASLEFRRETALSGNEPPQTPIDM